MARVLTLPPEGTYTEAELAFIESSPDNFWPENQDSNFGQFRQVLCEIIQENIDFLSVLNLEAFFLSASRYLNLWEEMMGLPTDPTGKTEPQRRSAIAVRREYGVFTRARRARAIESFIMATFGEAASFTPDGIPLTAGGIPLFSGINSLAGTYLVVEDVENFHYTVYILSALGVDQAGLARELTRLTPAHLSFDVQYVASMYYPTIIAAKPKGYWRMHGAGTADSSGFGHNLVHQNGPTTGQTGLLSGDTDQSVLYDGVNDYSNIAGGIALGTAVGAYTYEAWVKYPNLPDTNWDIIYIDTTPASNHLYALSSRKFVASCRATGVGAAQQVVGTTTINTNTKYLVHQVYDGAFVRLYVNGVQEGTPLACTGTVSMNGELRIANFAGTGFESNMYGDEIAVYDRALSPAECFDHYIKGA